MALNQEMENYALSVQEEIKQIVRDMCAIPAPSHHEEKRAEFCKKWFEDNGFENVSIDAALNVLAPVNVTSDNKITIYMAHTDTVFPELTPLPFSEDENFMYSPGVTDDTANLAVLMVCARYFKDNFKGGKDGVLFVANSCEEGLGNLKGSRQIMADFAARTKEFITIDGTSLDRIVTCAVGSHRYKVTVKTEGGHSYGNFGNRNAIAALSSMISLLYSVKVPVEGNSKTTYNVGTISGGTSVNTIAQDACMMYEYRSDNKNCLAKMQKMFEQAVETFRCTGIEVDVEKVGDRPCSGAIDETAFAALKNRISRAIKETLSMDSREASSSTDANMPLSLGIPAVCISGCRGAGCHTREEKLEKASLLPGCRLLLDVICGD